MSASRGRLRLVLAVFLLAIIGVAGWLGWLLHKEIVRATGQEQVIAATNTLLNELAAMTKEERQTATSEELVSRIHADGTLIVKDRTGQLIDVWGNRILVNVKRQDEEIQVEVWSMGPDGIQSTADDLFYSGTIPVTFSSNQVR